MDTNTAQELRERVRRWAESPEGEAAMRKVCADIKAAIKAMEFARPTTQELMNFHVDRIDP